MAAPPCVTRASIVASPFIVCDLCTGNHLWSGFLYCRATVWRYFYNIGIPGIANIMFICKSFSSVKQKLRNIQLLYCTPKNGRKHNAKNLRHSHAHKITNSSWSDPPSTWLVWTQPNFIIHSRTRLFEAMQTIIVFVTCRKWCSYCIFTFMIVMSDVLRFWGSIILCNNKKKNTFVAEILHLL